jgi:hypothetical protein
MEDNPRREFLIGVVSMLAASLLHLGVGVATRQTTLGFLLFLYPLIALFYGAVLLLWAYTHSSYRLRGAAAGFIVVIAVSFGCWLYMAAHFVG